MYSYSHENNSGWMGKYPRPQDALIAGRAMYGDENRIYVARWSGAHYSDLSIGASAMLAYMREDAAGKVDDAYLDVFDSLTDEQINELDTYIVDAIGEWESDLPDEQQFAGHWIDIRRGYSQGEEVRPGHFQ